MATLTLDRQPAMKLGESTVTLVLHQYMMSPSGHAPALSKECRTLGELDAEIRTLNKRLNELREQAKDWFIERGTKS